MIYDYKIDMLWFSLYKAIITESKIDFKNILKTIEETMESELNIKINDLKTKILVFSREII